MCSPQPLLQVTKTFCRALRDCGCKSRSQESVAARATIVARGASIRDQSSTGEIRVSLFTRTGVLTLIMASLTACAASSQSVQRGSESVATGESQAAGAALAGTWHGTLTDPQGIGHPIELTLVVNGGIATGTIVGVTPDGPQSIKNGKVQRNQLSFQIDFKTPYGDEAVIQFSGTVYGNRIRGVHGSPGMPMDLAWEATKR
jgi:hypothetical protein